jgi:peptidoglycan/LPS O-acetylase OafA/YrhL
MSFPLYLYHYPVGIVFASLFAGAHSALSAWAAGAISCGVAVVMYYAVEPPLRRVRNRVRGQVIVLDQGLSAVARRDAQQDRQRVEA